MGPWQRTLAGVIAAWLAACTQAVAGSRPDKPWIEVRSAHFRVLTDGREKDARRIAREFERIRSVFVSAFKANTLDTRAPLLVLAPRDESSMRALTPWWFEGRSTGVAGFFDREWQQDYAIVRLDANHADWWPVVNHEYTHAMMALSFKPLPIWLNEGLAVFYSGTFFEKDKIVIGAPLQYLRLLRSGAWPGTAPLIPLETLLDVDSRSPYYSNRHDSYLFYGQSWALVHYLVFGPEMESGRRFNDFFDRLQKGEEQKKAFREVFGPPGDIQNKLALYLRRPALSRWEIDTPAELRSIDVTSRTLSAAETDAELGSFKLWTGGARYAREPLLRALSAAGDAVSASLHEQMGLLFFAEGKDEAAAQEFAKALDQEPRRALSLYFAAMIPGADRDYRRSKLEGALENVIAVDPTFAPARSALARVHLEQGRLEKALAQILEAERLEPMRPGPRLLRARILLRMGRPAVAAALAADVAKAWTGADRYEALDLWRSVPPEDRATSNPLADDSSVVVRRVRSIECTAGGERTVEVEGQARAFRGKHVPFSYSDSFWFGGLGLPCSRAQGLRVVLNEPTPSEPKLTAVALLDTVEDAQ